MNLNSQRLKQAVLAALADKDMVKILDYAMFKDKCVNDIIKECDIPHTTAYRKIKYLLDQGLLVCTKNLSQNYPPVNKNTTSQTY